MSQALAARLPTKHLLGRRFLPGRGSARAGLAGAAGGGGWRARAAWRGWGAGLAGAGCLARLAGVDWRARACQRGLASAD